MRLQERLNLHEELRDGLVRRSQKRLPAYYLYDEVGSALFDAITVLPEYGLTRADQRLLDAHAAEIAELAPVSRILDLGSGSGSKARVLLSAYPPDIVYSPIDVSVAALENCVRGLAEFRVEPIQGDFIGGLERAAVARTPGAALVTFLGSNIGNFERSLITPFLRDIRAQLRRGDFLLLGGDLLKPVPQLIDAYDDAAGVTAAFNRNLLVRFNREFNANFDPRCFAHVAIWNEAERRVEMHLRASAEQRVFIGAFETEIVIRSGETIHTESSHKFAQAEVSAYAGASGFDLVASWIDEEWPFAEMLFQTR